MASGQTSGGTLALQAGLSFPHMLAGICAVVPASVVNAFHRLNLILAPSSTEGCGLLDCSVLSLTCLLLQASWVTADLPAVDGKSELPILMCHGDEDTMVPIAVARRSCNSCCFWHVRAGDVSEYAVLVYEGVSMRRSPCLGKSLASKGYSKVNLVTVKGLRHQLIAAELEEIFEFLRQVLPQGARGAGEFLDASESPDAFPSCLV